MRKGWLVLLSLALVVALAVPAAAEMKLTGFYRVKPTMSNFIGNGNSPADDPGDLTVANTQNTRAFTEMRNRLRFEVGDENVKGVTFFELDGTFGDTGGKVGRNQGFASNGDSINLETKNAYIWFKVPDTSLTFTVGLQGYSDEFAGLLFGASDQAGVVMGAKFDPVTLRVTWLKLRDDVTLNNASGNAGDFDGTAPDDNFAQWATNNAGDRQADYYAVDAKFSATPNVAVTGHVAFLRDSQSAISEPTEVTAFDVLKAYYVGANVTAKLAPVTLTGFVLYNFGTFEQLGAAPDIDISGYAASVRADAALGPGNLFVEALYVSGDDTTGDDEFESVVTGSDFANLTSFYWRPDLQILFPNIDMINSAKALTLNPNNKGRGLILGAVGYSMKFSDKFSGKVGGGYLKSNENRFLTDNGNGDEAMATEVNANVNYNIVKGLDFGLYGAYAFLGDFYSNVAGDPDDLYSFFGRLNFAF